MTERRLGAVVLVMPPQLGLLDGFSAGLIALANFVSLRLPAVRVKLLDLSHASWKETRTAVGQTCKELGTSSFLVGVTATTASYQAALRVCREFRRGCPDVTIVLGGPHASPEAKAVLEYHKTVDYVIRGEGENALVDLLRSHPDIGRVPNLVYRDGKNIVENAPGRLLEEHELDLLRPDFNGTALGCTPGKFGYATYVSARGCPLSCAFCAVSNEQIRAKSIPAVIRDLEHLAATRGFRKIAIEDNFFAHSPRRTQALCAAIARLRQRVAFSWDCQTRVESLRNAAVVSAMAEAGCEAVYLGVESLDTSRLRYLGKTNSPNLYITSLLEDVLPRVLSSGMRTYINLQVGLPAEVFSTGDESLAKLQELGEIATRSGQMITVFPQLHVVYPGTRHHEDLLARLEPSSLRKSLFEEFTLWERNEKALLKWLRRRFAHGSGGIPIGILDVRPSGNGKPLPTFSLAQSAIDRVDRTVRQLSSLKGIELFNYERHLARQR